MQQTQQSRIKKELLAAGVTTYALTRAAIKYLPNVLHQDEHIKAAVFGRTEAGGSVLVATDKRLVFVNKHPLLATCDDISYEVVSGVSLGQVAGLFCAITVFTKMGNYTIRYVNTRSAHRLKHYLDTNRLESAPHTTDSLVSPLSLEPDTVQRHSLATLGSTSVLDGAAERFVAEHTLGVLSTVDRNGELHGAAIYYVYDDTTKTINFLTKSHTTKLKNIIATHRVALTIYDESRLQTVQMRAVAELEPDATRRQSVYLEINRERQYGDEQLRPPVAKLSEGSFTVVRLVPTEVEFRDYKYRN